MIAFLRGTLAGKTPASAYLDVAGVGYEVVMSQAALSKLPAIGESVQVYTYLQLRNEAICLYGFLSEEEKALFEKLIDVSGVGAKMALAALSVYAPAQLADAIARQDIAAVQRVPGVGKKTASRIVLELKGSLERDMPSLFGEGVLSGEPLTLDNSSAVHDATEALLSMGFSSAEADLALKGAPEGADEGALVKYALKRLGS